MAEPDREAILARRQHAIDRALGVGGLLAAGAAMASTMACPRPCLSIHEPAMPAGVYLAEPPDHTCRDCEALEARDVIVTVDGEPATTARVRTLDDGRPHALTVHDRLTDQRETMTITLDPGGVLLGVDTDELRRTPAWAQRRLFAGPVTLPAVVGLGPDRPWLDVDVLREGRHLVVYFSVEAASDRQTAALCLRVLQRAQADLNAAGIQIAFVQLGPMAVPPMDHEQLAAFVAENQVGETDGGPLPLLPTYRTPNQAERRHADAGGLESFGEPPNIVILDEGVVRWHSAGVTPDPSGEIASDTVYTINAAVLFALRELDP